MRYSDSLLADGEVVVRRARQHWLAVLSEGTRAWALFLVGLLALVIGILLQQAGDTGKGAGSALAVVALIALALGLVLGAYRLLAWRAQDYLVTNRRVIQVDGILNKRAADSSLEKINDAILTQGVLGRILGYGDLEVLTASEAAIDRFHMLARAADFKREMLNQKHALELDMSRPPAPPLRADWPAPTAAPAVAPEPAGSSASASPASASSAPSAAVPPQAAQVMATLERLAELRDRGAITAQEFEAKKAELLARL